MIFRKQRLYVLIAVMLAFAGSHFVYATLKDGKTLFALVCAKCHGSKGEGMIEFKTPSIASMPKGYVTRQLDKFRSDYVART